MNGKQQFLTPKSVAIGSLVAVATAFSAAIVSPLSAKAQNSPVSPTTPVDIVDFSNFNLGGTETSSETTTTETTTTTDGTTTTTTTTTSSTTETSSTTDTSSSQETTEISTEVATDTSTTESTTVLESTNVSTGVEAQTGVSATSSQSVAIVISLAEQYATATGIDFLFISSLASELGVNGDLLVGTLIFENVRGLRGNKQAALVAFRNALKKAGVFEFASFNNEAFAALFTSFGTAEEVAAAFNGLSDIRILFLSRASKFFANNFKFRLFRVRRITFAQFLVYKSTGVRSLTFPAERDRKDD